jgi:hypothetical protein
MNTVKRHRAVVLRNVICARKNHHRIRVQVYHILAKAYQHLHCCLAGNTPVNISAVCKKDTVFILPKLCNGIAHKYNTFLLLRPGFQHSVFLRILVKVAVKRYFLLGKRSERYKYCQCGNYFFQFS